VKGSYTLLIRIPRNLEIEVGSLGFLTLKKGYYAYNGSAFGPGGLKRVERHQGKSEEGGNCHWHVDYLLTLECSEVVDVFRKKDSDHECSLSRNMQNNFEAIDSFGCSDCDCKSHLYFSEDRKKLVDFFEDFYLD